MKKGLLFIVTLICAGLFLTSGILSATEIPETIVIDGKTYAKDKKGPVNFNHAKHSKEYGAVCTDCHHNYVDGKNIWVEGGEVKKCGDCHDPEKSEGNKKKLMTAFHDNCKGCHKEKNKEGKKAPDKKCEECHQK